MDHLDFMQCLVIGSRLKRLSDYFMNQAKEVYQEAGIDFQPKLFPLFSLLCYRKSISVTEAAKALKFSHPHVVKLSRELEERKLIISKIDKKDSRSRRLTLSTKGEKLKEKVEPIWDAIKYSIEEVYSEAGFNFIDNITKFEKCFDHQSLTERVRVHSSRKKIKKIKICPYQDKYKKDFENLNRQWLEKYFSVEEIDLEYFKNPNAAIREKGGEIFFALFDGKVVGTCSLFKDRNRYELAKMAVDESYQGLGIGHQLMNHCIRYAKLKNAKSVYLITNSTLVPAINLYLKKGFKITYEGQHPVYSRGDVIMEKAL